MNKQIITEKLKLENWEECVAAKVVRILRTGKLNTTLLHPFADKKNEKINDIIAGDGRVKFTFE